MPEGVRLLLEGTLNGVWQGGLLALVMWSVLCASPGVRPRTRYVFWLVTLVAIVALPAFYVARNWPSPATPAQAPEVAAIAWTPLEPPLAPESMLPIEVPAGDAALFLLGVWLVGMVGLVVRLAAGYLYLRWLKRSSEPADGRLKGWVRRWISLTGSGRAAQTRTTSAVGLPMAAGLIRPAILFPKKLAEDLTEAEAQHVWLHELAHVRRRDDWTQLAQKLAQAIGFFQPAVYWIGRRMNLERELACDEWVVSRTGAAKSYAACLAKLAALSNRHPAPALGMATHKKQIFRRVEMILSQSKNNSSRRAATAVAVLVALVAGAVAVVAFSSPAFVLAQSAEPLPLLAQAKPVPPAPPAPPSPAPAPAAAPRPEPAGRPSPAIRNEMREIRKEMRALAEEIRKVAKEIRTEVDTNIRANTDEIREVANQIREKVNTAIRPRTAEILRLKEQIEAAAPNKETMAKLEAEIAEIERGSLLQAELEIRELEKKIQVYENKIRPSEDVIRKLEQTIRSYEEKMRKLERDLRRRFDDEPPAPPAAPAPPEV